MGFYTKHVFEGKTVLLPNIIHEKSSQTFLYEAQFVSYLDKLVEKFIIRHAVPICLNHNQVQQDLSVIDHFILIDMTTFQVKVSQATFEYINNFCSRNVFVILPIKLVLVNSSEDAPQPTTAHSNLVIIDNIHRTVEYFEPHGITIDHSTSNVFNIPDIVSKVINILFPFTGGYTNINSAQTCLFNVGVQYYQNSINSSAGHCLAWSLYFLTVRLLNNDLVLDTSESISEFLHRFLTTHFQAYQLDDLVRKFMTFVHRFTQNNKPYTSDIEFNINSVIPFDTNQALENRIEVLSQNYFQSKDTNKSKVLFEELITYRHHPKFHTIMHTIIQHQKEADQNNDEFMKFINYLE
jgi:hypothetical protein